MTSRADGEKPPMYWRSVVATFSGSAVSFANSIGARL